MAAYGSVAEFAVTESAPDVDTVLAVPNAVDVAIAFPVPKVAAGKSVVVPNAVGVAIAFPTPQVLAGASVLVPNAVNVSFGFPLPAISAGFSVLAVPLNVALAFPAPTVSAGVNLLMPAQRLIEQRRDDGSVAEFAVTEAGTDVRGMVLLSFPAPIVSAGKNLLMPAPPSVALAFPPPELVVRRRAVRVRLLTA